MFVVVIRNQLWAQEGEHLNNVVSQPWVLLQWLRDESPEIALDAFSSFFKRVRVVLLV